MKVYYHPSSDILIVAVVTHWHWEFMIESNTIVISFVSPNTIGYEYIGEV